MNKKGSLGHTLRLKEKKSNTASTLVENKNKT
jgi:hypothetical protein